jgi:hypothetical protein
MLKRLTQAGAAVLLMVLAACGHQEGNVPEARADALVVSTPGWRVTQVLPNLSVGGLWAGGPGDAWLAADECDPVTCGASDTNQSNGTIVVLHWDGTSWLTVKPPKAYIDSPLDQGAAAITATTASNVWIAAARGSESVDYTDMLHWTGTGWAAPVRLPAAIQTAVTPSSAQLWAFGAPTKLGENGYFAHLVGASWVSGAFPLDVTTSAELSSSDVWAGGTTANGMPGFEHWDGRTWQATPLPDLGLNPPTSGPVHALLDIWVIGIAAVTPDDVWANITTVGDTGAYLLHWNGTAWRRVMVPYAGGFGTSVTDDGDGGLWLVLQAPDRKQWFCHYSAGTWTRTLVPDSGMQSPGSQFLAWIPGTRSQWEVSGVSSVGPGPLFTGTAILKYGS